MVEFTVFKTGAFDRSATHPYVDHQALG